MTTICHPNIASNSHAANATHITSAPLTNPASIASRVTGAPRRIVAVIKTAIDRRVQRTTDRLAFSHLLSLDQHILDDIGVTRDDVFWASRLPLSKNASRELEKIALANKNR